MIKKKYLALAAVAIASGSALLWPISSSRAFQFFGSIVPRVETSQRLVALTFDDGPSRGQTDQILSVLDEMNVKATFFLTGAELERSMAEGQKIVAAGHELGNHSYSHKRMVLVSPSFVRSEIERTNLLIREAGYTGEIFFRPPYGKKLLVLPYFLSRTGRKTIMCDVEPDSYPEVAGASARIIEHVRERVRPGSIILLHVMYPSRIESLKSVRGLIESLRGDGYRFVTVSELLAAAD